MIRMMFVDVDVQSLPLPVQQGTSSTSFKILVDDSQVMSKRSDASGVALKMSALTSAVNVARRRRRPVLNESADDAK